MLCSYKFELVIRKSYPDASKRALSSYMRGTIPTWSWSSRLLLFQNILLSNYTSRQAIHCLMVRKGTRKLWHDITEALVRGIVQRRLETLQLLNKFLSGIMHCFIKMQRVMDLEIVLRRRLTFTAPVALNSKCNSAVCIKVIWLYLHRVARISFRVLFEGRRR